VPGELAIGGTSLARGYLGRPDLTAERFQPDPWGEPGSRLYRTGDLARFLPDGDLEVLGRIDAQVKIRGVRIELGEIESALSGLPGVRQAVVSLRDGGIGGRRLVAFVVADPGVEPVTLRHSLRRLVPETMVPSVIVAVPELPLTPNGKLDRRAVAAWELPPPEATGGAPRTPLEERLVSLAAELLGLSQVGIGESFFDLGGHSLLAAQFVAALADRWGTEIKLQDLFETASLGELADLITERELLALDEAAMGRMLDGLAAEDRA
jgi:acyl carrier protein